MGCAPWILVRDDHEAVAFHKLPLAVHGAHVHHVIGEASAPPLRHVWRACSRLDFLAKLLDASVLTGISRRCSAPSSSDTRTEIQPTKRTTPEKNRGLLSSNHDRRKSLPHFFRF